MFAKFNKTFSVSKVLWCRLQNASFKNNQVKCYRSSNSSNQIDAVATATPQQRNFVKPASRRSVKCSAGVLLVQRQFMKNLCLVEARKDFPQQNNYTDSATLKSEQTQLSSPVLSTLKGYTFGGTNTMSVPYSRSKNKSLVDRHHYDVTRDAAFSILQHPGPSVLTRSANNTISVTADVHGRHFHRTSVRGYTTSPDPKRSEDVAKTPIGSAEEASEDTPLKVDKSRIDVDGKF